jgi:hypothetical protein
MNALLRHHAPAIDFSYSCFDCVLLLGYIRTLQFGGNIVAFLRQHRQAKLVTPGYFGWSGCGGRPCRRRGGARWGCAVTTRGCWRCCKP